jgi:type I restriction enzyme R subunit
MTGYSIHSQMSIAPSEAPWHAARDPEPSQTAQKRVTHVVKSLSPVKCSPPAQQGWLDRIRAHLVADLSIDAEDSEEPPGFTRHAGWTKADQDFGGKLIQFLREVNEAMAA